MFLSTPFHTVLGLTVMQSAGLLGGDWYPSLGLAWVDPVADQRVAGGILWAGGEFVAVTMLGGAGRPVDARGRAGGAADRPRARPGRGEEPPAVGGRAAREQAGYDQRARTRRGDMTSTRASRPASSCSTATTRRCATTCGWPSARGRRRIWPSGSSTPATQDEVVRLVDDGRHRSGRARRRGRARPAAWASRGSSRTRWTTARRPAW